MSRPSELLKGKAAVVTGASRGAGKGIAIALGSHGATVYVTGRSVNKGDAALPGTVAETAQLVTGAGGLGIAIACDHRNDDSTAALFEQVKRDHGGLDILVNNATFLHDELIKSGPFWTKPLDMVDILDVGLRSAYIASWHAAKLMSGRGGLIAFTSSYGANCYMHGAAYGAQKAGVDKFARDMAVDLTEINAASVSIWMGMLRTDRTKAAMEAEPEKYAGFWEIAETPEFTGHLIEKLYNDPNRTDRSGEVYIAAELAQEYGLSDEGRTPPSMREMMGGPPAHSPTIVE